MKVTSVSLFTNTEDAIRFDLMPSAGLTKYMINNIVGLDADELTPRFYGFSKDGTKRFYDFKVKPKNIIMRVVMNPDFALRETYSDLRDDIYRAISATRSGELEVHFHSGASTVARIYGHIVKMEVAYFSKTPELQITIRCNVPMFRGLTPIRYADAVLPTTNPVGLVDNQSTAPHGFKMEISVTATLANLTIQDKSSSPEWDFVVIPASNFLSGDKIYFSSEFNNRYLYMVRSGVTTHLMDRIVPGSVWPILFPKFNSFHFPGIASFDLDLVEFYAAYWGV